MDIQWISIRVMDAMHTPTTLDVAVGDATYHLYVDALGAPWIEAVTVFGQRLTVEEGTGHGVAARAVYALRAAPAEDDLRAVADPRCVTCDGLGSYTQHDDGHTYGVRCPCTERGGR